MRSSKIRAKLRAGKPVLVSALALRDPVLFELTALMGFDGIWLDLEHHDHSVETAAGLIRASRVGSADVMVRPAKGEFMRLGRLLEAGATGVMYPRCDDAAEARELVKWSKFAPLGRRGIDTGNADNPYCRMPLAPYIKAANEETFLVAQIEDPDALENVEGIAAVEGIDVIFFGPGDFSVLSGIPGEWDHPKIHDAIARVARAAAAAGKAWGMPSPSVDRTKQLLDMGARFIAHGADILMVKSALENIQASFGPLGFTFEARADT